MLTDYSGLVVRGLGLKAKGCGIHPPPPPSPPPTPTTHTHPQDHYSPSSSLPYWVILATLVQGGQGCARWQTVATNVLSGPWNQSRTNACANNKTLITRWLVYLGWFERVYDSLRNSSDSSRKEIATDFLFFNLSWNCMLCVLIRIALSRRF